MVCAHEEASGTSGAVCSITDMLQNNNGRCNEYSLSPDSIKDHSRQRTLEQLSAGLCLHSMSFSIRYSENISRH